MGFEEDNVRILANMPDAYIMRARDWSNGQFRACFGDNNLKELEEIMADKSCKRVLEIGCGEGKAIIELAKKYDYVEFYGIDTTDRYFKKFNVPENVTLMAGDAQSLPFEDGYFDVVFSVWTIDYVVDKLKAVSEAFRVLKDDGEGLLSLDLSIIGVDTQPRKYGTNIFSKLVESEQPIAFYYNQYQHVLKLRKIGNIDFLGEFSYQRLIESKHELDPLFTVYVELQK